MQRIKQGAKRMVIRKLCSKCNQLRTKIAKKIIKQGISDYIESKKRVVKDLLLKLLRFLKKLFEINIKIFLSMIFYYSIIVNFVYPEVNVTRSLHFMRIEGRDYKEARLEVFEQSLKNKITEAHNLISFYPSTYDIKLKFNLPETDENMKRGHFDVKLLLKTKEGIEHEFQIMGAVQYKHATFRRIQTLTFWLGYFFGIIKNEQIWHQKIGTLDFKNNKVESFRIMISPKEFFISKAQLSLEVKLTGFKLIIWNFFWPLLLATSGLSSLFLSFKNFSIRKYPMIFLTFLINLFTKFLFPNKPISSIKALIYKKDKIDFSNTGKHDKNYQNFDHLRNTKHLIPNKNTENLIQYENIDDTTIDSFLEEIDLSFKNK